MLIAEHVRIIELPAVTVKGLHVKPKEAAQFTKHDSRRNFLIKSVVDSLCGQYGPENMDKDGVHNGISIQNLLDIGRLLILNHGNEFGEQLFELEVVVQVSLGFSVGCEEYLELLMEDDMDEVVHECRVEAVLRLDFKRYAQQLVIEDANVCVRVVLPDLEHAVWAHQVMLEELRLQPHFVWQQIPWRRRDEILHSVAWGVEALLEALLFGRHFRHLQFNISQILGSITEYTMSDLNSEIDLIESDREVPQPVNNARVAHYRHLDEHVQADLGLYRSIRIDSYEPGKGEGRLVRLIYYDDIKRKFQVDDNCLTLFQRYAAYEVAFVSVSGEKGNGKSFILDKILNLSGVRGNHFSVNKDKGIFVWSQPFRKRNMKVFLLDCQGFQSQGLSLTEAKIHTILMLLSSAIIFNNKSKVQMDDAAAFQSLVQNSFSSSVYCQRSLTKEDQVLARSLYQLIRVPSTVAANHSLLKFFSEYNFTFLQDAMASNYKGKDTDLIQCSFLTTSCVSEKYIRHIAEVFSAVMQSVEEKTINGVTINGNIVCKLINHLAAMLSREDKLDVDRLFKSIVQELYVSAYNFCVIGYNDMLEKELRDQKPKGFDQLLQVMGRAQDQTMAKYHQFNLDPELHRMYLRKLQDHIDMKQKLILEINLKKTQNILREFRCEPAKNTESALKNLELFNRFHPELDHGRDQVMVEVSCGQLDGAVKNLGNYELQRELEKNESEVIALRQQLQIVMAKNRGVKQQYESEAAQLMKTKHNQQAIANKLQAERRKLEVVNGSKISANLNIDEVRSQYQPILMNNEEKIGKMKSDLAALTSKKPASETKDLSVFRKEIDELQKREKDLKDIVAIQQEEIKELQKDIAAKQSEVKAPPATKQSQTKEKPKARPAAV